LRLAPPFCHSGWVIRGLEMFGPSGRLWIPLPLLLSPRPIELSCLPDCSKLTR
jgi:hypothetical protein